MVYPSLLIIVDQVKPDAENFVIRWQAEQTPHTINQGLFL